MLFVLGQRGSQRLESCSAVQLTALQYGRLNLGLYLDHYPLGPFSFTLSFQFIENAIETLAAVAKRIIVQVYSCFTMAVDPVVLVGDCTCC